MNTIGAILMAGVATASMMPTEDTNFLAEEHLGRDLQEYGDEEYGDEEEDYDEDEESNEEVPVAVNDEKEAADDGWAMPDKMKDNNGRFGDQSKDKMKKRRNNNNEEKPFMMGGQPTSIDMSKLNQCQPGYGFHIRGVKRCVKDPQVEGGDRKGKGNNNGRFGDQSKGKGKGNNNGRFGDQSK